LSRPTPQFPLTAYTSQPSTPCPVLRQVHSGGPVTLRRMWQLPPRKVVATQRCHPSLRRPPSPGTDLPSDPCYSQTTRFRSGRSAVSPPAMPERASQRRRGRRRHGNRDASRRPRSGHRRRDRCSEGSIDVNAGQSQSTPRYTRRDPAADGPPSPVNPPARSSSRRSSWPSSAATGPAGPPTKWRSSGGSTRSTTRSPRWTGWPPAGSTQSTRASPSSHHPLGFDRRGRARAPGNRATPSDEADGT